MAERVKMKRRLGGGGNYFSAPKKNIDFIKTGSTTLDLALGGGWCENRIANIVGDKSTGKTLLAIEASANFARKYPKGKIRYRESESAFMTDYAEALGMPVDRVDFGEPIETVEDFFEDLADVVDKSKGPELYIVDSLDALSDRAEMERDMDQGTYGANKARKLSQLFRRLVRGMSSSQVTLIIVSQVRDNIGVTFGRSTSRSGGRALDFYASQVAYLHSGKVITRQVKGLTVPVAVNVRAKIDKNKVSLPMRQADFNMLFGYGIDDAASCLDWLKSVGHLSDVGLNQKMSASALTSLKKSFTSGNSEPEVDLRDLQKAVRKIWYEIEDKLVPTKKKYA